MMFFALLTLLASTSVAQLTWSTPVVIDSSTVALDRQVGPVLRIDDWGNVVIAWTDITKGDSADFIILERSTDGGKNWTRRIPYGGGHMYEGEVRRVWDVAIDHKGVIWLLWSHYPDLFSNPVLNVSRSTDNGNNFTTLFTAQEYGYGFASRLGLDATNTLYMLWDDTQFTLTSFAGGDVGARFDIRIPIDTLTVGINPSLVVMPNGLVYCLWEGFYYQNAYNRFIFCSTSLDSGRSFAWTTRVDPVDIFLAGGGRIQRFPSGVADSTGTLFVAYSKAATWEDVRLPIARSRNVGASFDSIGSLAEKGLNHEAKVWLDGLGALLVGWSDSAGINVKRSTDGGFSFDTPSRIGVGYLELGGNKAGDLFGAIENHLVYFTKTNVLDWAPPPTPTYAGFELRDAYPNPFNGSTCIEFTTRSSGFARLSVWNALGQRVAELLASQVSPGTHRFQWIPVAVATGMYIARMEWDESGGQRVLTSKRLLYIR